MLQALKLAWLLVPHPTKPGTSTGDPVSGPMAALFTGAKSRVQLVQSGSALGQLHPCADNFGLPMERFFLTEVRVLHKLHPQATNVAFVRG